MTFYTTFWDKTRGIRSKTRHFSFLFKVSTHHTFKLLKCVGLLVDDISANQDLDIRNSFAFDNEVYTK